MLYLGAFAVIFAAFMLWREYSRFLIVELSTVRAFIRALEDYREHMRCFLDSPRSWAMEYRDSTLEESGFLVKLREGCRADEAYISSCGVMYPGDAADGVLRVCFERLGSGYLDTELTALDSSLDRLIKLEGGMANECKKRTQAAGALLGACASGIVIMII